MVKGMTRRVVVVKSPDKKFFEEAVFFLCDDTDHGISGDQIVAEAQAIADEFTRDSLTQRKLRVSRMLDWLRVSLWALAGALAASLVWASAVFLF